MEVFKVFPKDRVPQRLPVSRPSFLLVEVFKGFPKDRVPQRLPVSRPSFLLVEMRSRCCSGRRRSVGHSSGSMLAGLGHCTSPSRHTAGASVFRSRRSASPVRRTTTTTSSMGRSLVFQLGSGPCGCASGSPPGTAGRGGGVCSLTL